MKRAIESQRRKSTCCCGRSVRAFRRSTSFGSGGASDVVDRVHLKQGDQLELRRPDGTEITAKLHCFDFLVHSQGKIGLGLSKPLTKAAIPVGTEVWKLTQT
jgi:hypothetical protein